MAIEGIDISDFQTVVSFHEVKSAGIGFAVCKATQGTYNTQATFAGYRDRIRSVGLAFGAYHFLDWSEDGRAQAEYFLSVYTPRAGDLPPMLDCEAFSCGPDQATATIAAFLQTVEPHLGGRRMLLYANWDAINSQAFVTDDFSGHPLWLAQYASAPSVPRTWAQPTIWQYGESGSVAGVEGAVDQDRFLGDAAAFAAFLLPNGSGN